MDWFNIILCLGFVIILTYSVFSALLIGRLPISLSETYYELRRVGKGWYFPVTLFMMGMTMMPIWLEKTAGLWYQFLVFIACAAIVFVSASPDYRKRGIERKVHYISAIVAVIAVILYHIFNGTWIILLISLIPSVIALFKYKESITLFLEISIIVSVYLSLI